MSADDVRWMQVALAEARRGLGRTSPNPAVGAVLVRDGEELSRGWHRAAGKPHAEVEALRRLPAGISPQGATLYVTLEPCSSHGRTPPCTDAIQRARIGRVVYGATDPDSRHQGRALELLTAAGISVTAGVLEKECSALNERWNHFIRTGRPWVILKAGMTLDGRISRPQAPGAPPPSQQITSAAARADAMRWRAGVDAILVGGGTLRVDNPRLNLRGSVARGRLHPRRVIWTRDAHSLPQEAEVFQDAESGRTLVSSAVDFPTLLDELGEQKITSLLVEGGSQVHGAVVDSGLVNEVLVYVAPVVFGGGLPMVGGMGVPDWADGLLLENVTCKTLGKRGDLRFHGTVMAPCAGGPKNLK